jgi:hypothetical protein
MPCEVQWKSKFCNSIIIIKCPSLEALIPHQIGEIFGSMLTWHLFKACAMLDEWEKMNPIYHGINIDNCSLTLWMKY